MGYLFRGIGATSSKQLRKLNFVEPFRRKVSKTMFYFSFENSHLKMWFLRLFSKTVRRNWVFFTVLSLCHQYLWIDTPQAGRWTLLKITFPFAARHPKLFCIPACVLPQFSFDHKNIFFQHSFVFRYYNILWCLKKHFKNFASQCSKGGAKAVWMLKCWNEMVWNGFPNGNGFDLLSLAQLHPV